MRSKIQHIIHKGTYREIKLNGLNYMGLLLFLAGGYSCSWMVTNDPGVPLPPQLGRVSGTQGQWWWLLLLLGTVGPSTLVPPVSGSFRMFRMMMIVTHKYDEIIGKMMHD